MRAVLQVSAALLAVLAASAVLLAVLGVVQLCWSCQLSAVRTPVPSPPLQAATSIQLRATAGLRLLPGDKADNILRAVEEYMKGLPFKLGEGGVGIMDGGFCRQGVVCQPVTACPAQCSST